MSQPDENAPRAPRSHPTKAPRASAASPRRLRGDHGRPDRLVLVTTSPRVPAELLSWPAWEALRSWPVYTAAPDTDQVRAVRAAGIAVTALSGDEAAIAADLRERARPRGGAVWLAGPGGDPGLARALGELVAREPGGAEVEVVRGSWDPPGARLLDVVAVMDRLRSPGGCPWDAEQTHASLAPYLLEEAYEAYDALQDGDLDALREELGDVLLQVAFQSRVAEEGDEPWSIDDVAADLVEKLVRRHPHVFAGRVVSGAGEVSANWDVIKRQEKNRESVLDGIPNGLPALLFAHTVRRKAVKAGVPQELLPGDPLFAEAGEDAEAALRLVARRFRDRVAAAERAARADGRDTSTLDANDWRRYWPTERSGDQVGSEP